MDKSTRRNKPITEEKIIHMETKLNQKIKRNF